MKSRSKFTWAGRLLGPGALLALALVVGCASKDVPISDYSADQLWEQGVAAYNDEEWDEAVRFFDRYVLTGGSDPRVVQARYYIGRAHFEKGQYVTAASTFSRLAGDLGRTAMADDARFMACRAYEELSPRPQLDQEYTRAAIDHCRALVDHFPDSEFADPAREIVERMRGRLAHKLYTTGDWYVGRHAYDSALIYFEDVVEQYPDTEWAPKSLLKQYEIYGILQYEEEQDEVRDRLLRAYPDSEAAQQVQNGSP
ncbi:MAG: outer membrane protein assembly factor BamD [Longimicrobiales bacterium]